MAYDKPKTWKNMKIFPLGVSELLLMVLGKLDGEE